MTTAVKNNVSQFQLAAERYRYQHCGGSWDEVARHFGWTVQAWRVPGVRIVTGHIVKNMVYDRTGIRQPELAIFERMFGIRYDGPDDGPDE